MASGVIGEIASGYPGYCGIIPKSCASVAEVLSQNGYATGWGGKNHNVPDNMTNQAGPYRGQEGRHCPQRQGTSGHESLSGSSS